MKSSRTNIGNAQGSFLGIRSSPSGFVWQVASENERVLDDPGPRSWFLAFGASSLDFELRVYVGNLDDRLQTLHELNVAIDRLVAEHDIEIAFPQLDLHVRDLPDGAASARPCA